MVPSNSRPLAGNQSRLLARRVLTGVVAFPILMGLVWVDGILLGVVAGLVVYGGLHEIFSMAKIPHRSLIRISAFIWACTVFGSIVMGQLGDRSLLIWSGSSYALILTAMFAIILSRRSKRLENFQFPFAAVCGVTLLTFSIALAVNLRQEDQGRSWLLLALLVPMAIDTGAYFIGGRWGMRKLAPSISPGKTWEGAAGGLIVGILAVMALNYILDLGLGYQGSVVLGFAISVVAQFGDLLESSLKRLYSVKDSGKLFPGHGGILDRIDSLVLIFPLVYYVQSFWFA